MGVLVFAGLGILTPAYRGHILQVMFLFFAVMGFAAGFVVGRLLKLFEFEDPKQTLVLTALTFPGIVFLVLLVLNVLIWHQASTGAVPLSVMFALVGLWFALSIPMVLFGGSLGFSRPAITLPVKVSKRERRIPDQPLFTNPVFMCVVGGVLPFGVVFTELFFILTSLWQHRVYYLFGFLAVVLALLAVTCAQVSIAMTYLMLAAENYHWWWRSFHVCASSGIYVFVYSCMYFKTFLQIEKLVPVILYFGDMSFSVCYLLY